MQRIVSSQAPTVTAIRLTIFISLCLIASMALANPPAGAEERFKGNAELGFVTTSGNTETASVNARLNMEAEYRKWRQTLKLEAFSSSDANGTTAERYLVSNKSDYKLTVKGYLFALLSFEADRFSGYGFRVNEALGYGRKLISEPDFLVEAELGLGARQSRLDDGSSEDELTTRVAGKLSWKIPPGNEFVEEISLDFGEESNVFKSNMSLSVQVVKRLAMKLSYSVIHVSPTPLGIVNTDSAVAVTLVYGF